MTKVSRYYEEAHVLMVEDDTVPSPGIFPVLHSVLRRRQLDRLAYIKLYHPYDLLGYLNPEPHRWLEWLALSSLLVFLYHLVKTGTNTDMRKRPQTYLLQIILVMSLLELLGRQAFLNILPIYSLVNISIRPGSLYPIVAKQRKFLRTMSSLED